LREIYDVIVVGTGIAGLTSAIFLKESGLNVLVLTKNDVIEETATKYAQGGIIAWKKEDSSEKLGEDILKAGYYYNNIDAVKMLAQEGPYLVFDFLIHKVGINFSKGSDNELHYTGEAAHSERRILHYEDYTGEKIQEYLIDYAKKLEIPVLTGHTSIDLIANNHHSRDFQELYKPREIMGVYVLNNHTQEVETFFSNYVILATGGVGNLYQHTTNPLSATGDGMSMAFRAGADIINAEFIQFHPTSLYHKDIKRFLISESLRGEGARLLDPFGREFIGNYSPHKELAPRDVIARALFEEMNKIGAEYMLLDISNYYQGEQPIAERFSRIYTTCLQGGIDITKEPIPIVPAAHYICGGIKVDLHGRTSLKNLYAIGEVSCTGIHGANRLASTSLLEGLLWGKKAADDIKEYFSEIKKKRFDHIPDWQIPVYTEEFDPLLLKQDLRAIQLTMWNYAGIVKTRKGLERAQSDLNYYSHRIFKFYKEAKLNKNIIELRNAIVSASLIVNSAIHNKKSIGCHYINGNK